MPKQQVDFSEEEDDIIEAYQFVYDEKSKKKAVKSIVKKFGEIDDAVNKVLRGKRGVKG